jgi:hypothetical protein
MMRTLLFLLVGLLLLAACLLLGRLFAVSYPGATQLATIAFISLWLAIAGTNLWVGVAKAGYTISDELPIFLLVFGVPTLVAVVVKWKFL